jgi:phospholipid transport system substrate-binding protein
MGLTIFGLRARRFRFAALAAALWLSAGPAAAQATPVAVVEGMHRALVEVAAMDSAPDLDTRVELLSPVLSAAHDFRTMGRVTVRRYWRDWSDAERDAFVDAFARLSITTYASRFANIGPDSFEILGGEADGDDGYRVEALIHRAADEPVSLQYEFREGAGGWRIVNVRAGRVSELGQMASAWSAILESGDLSDLLVDIEAQIAALDESA